MNLKGCNHCNHCNHLFSKNPIYIYKSFWERLRRWRLQWLQVVTRRTCNLLRVAICKYDLIPPRRLTSARSSIKSLSMLARARVLWGDLCQLSQRSKRTGSG
nr:MAG TPA: Protein of unknown function (DUF983) [Caudoviricetes sp.]